MTLPPGPGILYVVATPIGNLGDLSSRARDVMSSVDLIAAEDTRHTGSLLRTLGIATPLVSVHEHNESARVDALLEKLRGGASIALVSDAGTPLISDPGYALVNASIAAAVQVVAVPGPCAVTAALSVAGLPTDRFVFEGFLAPKKAARRQRLASLIAEERTLVFYEAPHRLQEALQDMVELLGRERHGVVCRELTKAFETVYHGSLADLTTLAGTDPNMTRGEIVVLVAGAAVAADGSDAKVNAHAVLKILLEEIPPSQAAKLAARITGAKRNELYQLAVRLSAAE